LTAIAKTAKTAKTAKKIFMAHLAAGQLDSVMDREEVARPIVDSAIAIHPAHDLP
jgi:hypothetical protein